MSKTSELKAKGYRTIKEIGKELNRELRPEDIPKEILRDGIKLNGILYPSYVIKEILEYEKLPANKKQELTNLKRYGVKSTSQVKKIKQKQINTLYKNYGVTVPAKNKEIASKISKTRLIDNIELRNIHNLIICSEYLGENKPLYFYCNDCGNLFKRLARNIQLKCPICSNRKNSTDIFIQKAVKIHGNKYLYDKVNYVNSKEKVQIYCKKCNEYFLQQPCDHLSGHGHNCYKSKQEEQLAQFLIDNHIFFEREKTFTDCIGKKKCLPFDFYIPSRNLLIEIQGEQHLIEKSFFKNFEERKRLDKIKRDYALKKYNFLEIFYYENIIEKIRRFL